MKRSIITSCLLLAITAGASAHGGHTMFESDLIHYVTAPGHLLPAISLGVLITIVALARKYRLSRAAKNKT